MRHKGLSSVSVKDADQGTVEAVFATLNVVDHDGDVILNGAFADGQKVRISAWNHSSWGGPLPVGKGTIREQGNEAIFEGRFFLDTTSGRDTFETVKGLDELGEWSFGFDLLPGSTRQGEHEGRQVQFIGPRPDGAHGIDVHEVSPVLLGAGIDTRTLAVKGLAEVTLDDLVAKLLEHDPEMVAEAIATTNLKFNDHLTFAAATVEKVAPRLADVAAKRAEKGKGLGEDSRESLDRLKSANDALCEVATSAAPTETEDLELEALYHLSMGGMNHA